MAKSLLHLGWLTLQLKREKKLKKKEFPTGYRNAAGQKERYVEGHQFMITVLFLAYLPLFDYISSEADRKRGRKEQSILCSIGC